MRNSGRTTKQISEAPKNAIFICTNPQEVRYCRSIAYNNNRTDIKFISNIFLREKLKGLNQQVILDHSIKPGFNMDTETYDYIQFHNNKVQTK